MSFVEDHTPTATPPKLENKNQQTDIRQLPTSQNTPTPHPVDKNKQIVMATALVGGHCLIAHMARHCYSITNWAWPLWWIMWPETNATLWNTWQLLTTSFFFNLTQSTGLEMTQFPSAETKIRSKLTKLGPTFHWMMKATTTPTCGTPGIFLVSSHELTAIHNCQTPTIVMCKIVSPPQRSCT